MSSRYNPAVFNVRNIPDAKKIILTPEGTATTEERWVKETPYLGGLMMDHLQLQERHRVLDYGTGIGRMAKELIGRSGCSVIGVDTSIRMRALAPAEVMSDRFLACAPAMIEHFSSGFHCAISVWALQHIAELDMAVARIHQHLRSFGKFFVVNSQKRFLPMSDGAWFDDGRDVRALLGDRFLELDYGLLDALQTTEATSKHAWWGCYQRRA